MIDDTNEFILYDIKDEFKKQLNISDDDSNLVKWEKYKDYKVNRYSVYGIDCDVSLYAVGIYNKAWEYLKSARPTKQYEKVSLDKLEDFSISIDSNSERIIPSTNIMSRKDTSICFSREYKYQLILRDSREYYRGDTMTSFTNIYKHYKKNFETNSFIRDEVEELAKNYHTIGNMIPVPSGFNSSRAGKDAKYDYWDLTMLKIKEWYNDTSNDKPLKMLLNDNKNAIEPCKKWLNKFDNWNDFVEKNYLSPFVGTKEADGNYTLLYFWKDHSFENCELLRDANKFLEFLKKLNECIKDRNKIIYDSLLSERQLNE